MFADRHDAGRQLAQRLARFSDGSAVVLGLPRGGVVVAAEIADALGAPLDVLIVRKLGAPGREELAIGAVADGDAPFIRLNQELITALDIDASYIEQETEQQLTEARRRNECYRRGRRAEPLQDRTVIVVDDGIATGATVRAALAAVRQAEPAHLVLAVPVGPPNTLNELEPDVDELVCLAAPHHFVAVGQFYDNFDQTTDEQVIELLDQHASSRRP